MTAVLHSVVDWTVGCININRETSQTGGILNRSLQTNYYLLTDYHKETKGGKYFFILLQKYIKLLSSKLVENHLIFYI